MPGRSFESLTIRVAFTAADSGTGTSATGVLQAVSVSGTDKGSVCVRTEGLAAGTFTVDAATVTGTAPVALGTFTVGDEGDGPACTKTRFGGPRGIAFPDGIDPFDIASLAISDSNANVLFTADLTTITDGSIFARTPIVSGTTVTAAGVACIHACAKAGVVTGTLTVAASGLPAGASYTYDVNGTEIGPVTTGSGGSLKVVATENPTNGTLPAAVDLFTVTSVAVYDASGNLILSASF